MLLYSCHIPLVHLWLQSQLEYIVYTSSHLYWWCSTESIHSESLSFSALGLLWSWRSTAGIEGAVTALRATLNWWGTESSGQTSQSPILQTDNFERHSLHLVVSKNWAPAVYNTHLFSFSLSQSHPSLLLPRILLPTFGSYSIQNKPLAP